MLSIRPAGEEDAALIFEMLKASATEQGFPDELAVTEDNVREDGFGPRPRFRVLIAEADSTPAGMALFFINYSTWGSRLGLYLEDIYVRPEYGNPALRSLCCGDWRLSPGKKTAGDFSGWCIARMSARSVCMRISAQKHYRNGS